MLLRVLSAETLKLKRTLALWLAFVAPLLVIALQSLIILRNGFEISDGFDPWLWFSRSTLALWGILMLPLFITLQTALLANLEHGEKTWKQLFAMPVPRWSIYAAKFIVNVGIIGLSSLVLWAGQIVAGWIMGVVKPTLGFYQWPLPWLTMLWHTTLMFLAVWLIIAIHTWVSLRWHSFALASGVGIAATVISLVLVNSEWAQYFPWTQVVNLIAEKTNIPLALTIGIAGGLAASILGGWDVTRRDVL